MLYFRGSQLLFWFQLFQTPFQVFGDCSRRANCNWCHCHPYVAQFLYFSGKIQLLVSLIAFFVFTLRFAGIIKSTIRQILIFLFISFYFILFIKFICISIFYYQSLGLVFWPGLSNLFMSQNSRKFYALHLPVRILVCTNTIWVYAQISISNTDIRGSPLQPITSILVNTAFHTSF